ncbi:MAG: hypothetical protein SFU56_01120 [Capsulimonadales bacterium]|nr:hypothetical protein [Capsulimonadales bacterium]
MRTIRKIERSRLAYRELMALLASDRPGDSLLLERTLSNLPADEAVPALYAITGKSRPLSLAMIPNLLGRVLLAMLLLRWVMPSPTWTLLHFVLALLVLRWVFHPIQRQLRFRKTRRAVFFLAGFNDARAVEELLRYRRFRPGTPEQEALTERAEGEMTRLLDELTGHAFIPGIDLLYGLAHRECLSRTDRRPWTPTRIYFYIAILRLLSVRNSDRDRALIARIARRPHRNDPGGQVWEVAVALSGKSSVPVMPVRSALASEPVPAMVRRP